MTVPQIHTQSMTILGPYSTLIFPSKSIKKIGNNYCYT